MTLDPERFFLPPRLIGDDARFRAPVRRSARLVPLVDARKAYGEMERAILAATETVHLCLWEFDPLTALVSGPLADGRGDTWADLLVAKAEGVIAPPAQVRVIVADCDAVFFNTMHEKAWSALDTLMARRGGLDTAAAARLEVIVGLHPAVIDDLSALDFVARKAIELAIDAKLDQRVAALNAVVDGAGPGTPEADEAVDRFHNMPGLWRHVQFDPATATFTRSSPAAAPTLRPASHHQKLCLVDGRIGFCGGLDIAPSRIDDGRHEAPSPWHDVQCRVEGAPVFDLERNFFARWNTELLLFESFVALANAAQPPLRLAAPRFTRMSKPAGDAAFAARPGTARVQMVRTVTGRAAAGTLLPEIIRRDIEECYLKAIAEAQHFIYLENQYLRWSAIADAIVARRATAPIKVIAVVPTLPEEIRAAAADPVLGHQLELQSEFLGKLAVGLGADFGLFALAQRRFTAAPDPLDLFGSAQVYVHSKVMIVDDAFATIGSANGNGRGYTVDGELNLAWSDPRAVRRFRLELWGELLGRPRDLGKWTPADFLAAWRSIALVNGAVPAPARRGFVVPASPGIPDPARKLPFPDLDRAS